MHIYIYIYMYTYIHICMCVCIHIFLYINGRGTHYFIVRIALITSKSSLVTLVLVLFA